MLNMNPRISTLHRTLQRGLSSSVWNSAAWKRHLRAPLSTTSTPTTPTAEAETEDHFETMALPRQFFIDEDTLKQSYRRLMTKYHPDKHSTKSAEDQSALEEKASKVTHAYETLKRPHTRATHLLELHGSEINETDSTKLVGMEFLMDIMQIRDSIENTHADDGLKEIRAQNSQKIQQACDDLTVAFQEQDIAKAKEIVARLQYWNRIEETVREKIEHFE